MQKTKFKQTEIGKIPEDWNIKQVKEVAKVNELTIKNSFPHKEIEYIDIRSVDKGKIIEIKKIPSDKTPSRAKRIVRDNDILISTVRPNLKHFVFIKSAKQNTIASTGFAVITSKEIAPQFLYSYLTTDRYTAYLSAIADTHTSAYPAFNPDVIENSVVPFPKKEEQKSIAKILSDLDSKIELNHQMNQTLEAIGHAIFKNWFVDFEFPNEEGKPYKSNGGEMMDSELGEIPKGWEIKELGDFGGIICGKTPSKAVKEYFGGKMPFIKIPDMQNQVFVINSKDSLTQRGAETQKNKTIPKSSICVSCIATVGLVCITDRQSQTNQQINSIVPKEKYFTYYLYYRLKSLEDYLKILGSGGSATLNVNTTIFSDIKLLKPDIDLLGRFHMQVKPIFLNILNNLYQINSLSKIRDTLLPKLMSGQIRVPVEV